MFYLTTHSTHFIYGYMVSDILLRTILIVRKETHCRHIGYSLRLTARFFLYAPSHRQDSTYHRLCYTSRGALVECEIATEGNESKHLSSLWVFNQISTAAKLKAREKRNVWMNEWMFNKTQVQKINWLMGVKQMVFRNVWIHQHMIMCLTQLLKRQSLGLFMNKINFCF